MVRCSRVRISAARLILIIMHDYGTIYHLADEADAPLSRANRFCSSWMQRQLSFMVPRTVMITSPLSSF
jgi:hypothetical protein